MSWCPNCKNEYREGITICADCGCELVASEEVQEGERLIFGEKEQMEELKRFLEWNNLEGISLRLDEEDGMYELLVQKADKQKAAQIAAVYLQQEAARSRETAEQEGAEEEETEQEKVSYTGIYENSAEKAADNRSSAWILFVVGGIGMLVLILGMTGILPLPIGGSDKYMIYGVMSAVFLVFLVMGVISMRNSKVFAQKAESENSLRQTLVDWCEEHMNAEEIDAGLMESEEDCSEELLYFRRFEKMKELLNYQFVNLDQAFLDNFIDEQYEKVFGKEQNQ